MLFGRERIDFEIMALLDDHSREDLARLKLMLNMHGSKDLDGLRKVLIEFTKPYQDKLIESWEESIRVLGNGSLASYFDNLKQLFD